MSFFTLEHSKTAYWADFVLYGVAIMGLAIFLLLDEPHEQWLVIAAVTLAGLSGWTVIEYALHRFVLHGLQPFKQWHEEHHQRPTALICAPTIFNALLFASLIFLPALLLGNVEYACAWTLGILTGYQAYGITHHAVHHWRADSAWLKRRKVWHATHHHTTTPVHYGVTTVFWDHIFGSVPRSAK